MQANSRTADFSARTSGRYWWFQQNPNFFVPPVFAFLSEDEWELMLAWYSKTDAANSAGEANIPAISFLHGLIMGSRIKNIVQLGHYEGFSTLLIGFMLRKMGLKRSFCTIDIDPKVSNTTQEWVDKAGLQDYVKVLTGDSASPEFPRVVRDYFQGEVNMVFIDSSHAYQHTLTELDLWYPVLKPLGIILMHDVSKYAMSFDYAKLGGVQKAVTEWAEKNKVQYFLLNGSLPQDYGEGVNGIVYGDICGIGIMQKPY